MRGRFRKAQTRGNAPSPGSSRFARAPTSPRAAGRGEKSKSALAARARPSSADAKGKKALRHDLVRSGRRWDRRRHDHAQQNPIRRRMSICSPDEAQRNPGTIARLATPIPDFTSFIRATKGKGGGTPADAYLQPPRPRLHPLPLAGEDEEGARRASTQTSVRKSAHTKSTRRAACRRSTAALAAASQRRSSAPDALPGTRSFLSQSSELLADRS